MSISSELMYAILAMDSYNRGYDPGIAGLGGENSSIGTATVKKDATQLLNPGEAQAAGFYAVAYEWDGETIISYRGTDNLFIPGWIDDSAGGNDLWNGYGTGIGDPMTEQARLAAEFYQAVTGTQTGDPLTGSATLIGHSLGGGLAGFVGALYHENVTLFDNMPFEWAANSAYTHAASGDAVWQPLLDDLYNGSTPWTPLIASNFQEGYAVTGEFLAAFRGLQNTPVTYLDSHAGFELPDNLHSQALLTMLIFAENEGHVDWVGIGDELTNALFNRNVADQAGYDPKGTNGRWDEEDKQLSALAYSALDEGTLVFGNTGIRALYNDADALGKLVTDSTAPLGFANTVPHLAEAIVQFAGQMALGKVKYSDHEDKHPELGFLTVEGEGRLLKADLTKGLWTLNNAQGGLNLSQNVEVKGIQSMLDPFFANDPAAAVLLASMQRLYGVNETHDSSVINRLDFALGTDPLTVELSEPEADAETSQATTTSLFVGLGTDDQVKGNKDNNMLLGRDGSDRLYGREGRDILLGGQGEDTLFGGSGDDVLHGGEI